MLASTMAADLIKIPEQPRLGWCKRAHPPISAPDREAAPHKLIPTG